MSSRRSQGRKEVPAGAAGAAAAESKGKKAKTEAGGATAGAIAPPSHAIQKGTDSEGKAYKNLDELWKEQFEDSTPAAAAGAAASSADGTAPAAPAGGKQLAWYQKGADYWMTQAASVDGVLGGFGHVSPVDIIGSKSFLRAIPNVKFGASIDCGAGIGRISKGLLAPLFARVDLVEQNPVYVAKAKEYCAGLPSMKSYWVQGLQEFQFEPQAYDCIWIQWVIGHLPDSDFVPFMRRCIAGLVPSSGVIVLKENNAKKGFVMDLDDQSVTRTDAQYRTLFEQAGLELIATELQKNFPAVLFPVRMYALRPKAAAAATAPAEANSAPAAAAAASSSSTPA